MHSTDSGRRGSLQVAYRDRYGIHLYLPKSNSFFDEGKSETNESKHIVWIQSEKEFSVDIISGHVWPAGLKNGAPRC
jgi:hypothetical protein